jgi:HK97 family phage major capsid protein
MAGMTESERRIKEARASLWENMKPTVEKLHRGESVTAEERKAYFERDAELNGLTEELRMLESAQTREAAANESVETRGGYRGDETETREANEARAFEAYLRGGNDAVQALPAEQRGLLIPRDGSGEQRLNPLSTLPVAPAAGSTLAGEGGYLVPQGFWHNLQIAMKAYGGTAPLFRQVKTSTGNPLPWPTMDPTGIVGSLLGENTQVTEVDFSFGQGMLSAYTYTSGLHLASIQIVNDSAFDVDEFVTQRVGEAIGRAQAAAVISGTGSAQPLGLNTAVNARGAGSIGAGGYFPLTAAHNVTTLGGTVTELAGNVLAFDTILKMVTFVDPAYRDGGNCGWIMNDAQMQNERGVVDSMGHPLWQPSVQVGGTSADRLYGYPVKIDNNVPNLVLSTTGGPVFGSLDHAMVLRTVDQAGLLRLVERYADFLQVGFIGYVRFDSRSNDLRAVTVAHAAAT